MEPHGAWCRGCRGVNTHGHLQLVPDHEGGGQGVRTDTDDVNITTLTKPPQPHQHQHDRLACVETTARRLASVVSLLCSIKFNIYIYGHCYTKKHEKEVEEGKNRKGGGGGGGKKKEGTF